jgi:hypothetical protein
MKMNIRLVTGLLLLLSFAKGSSAASFAARDSVPSPSSPALPLRNAYELAKALSIYSSDAASPDSPTIARLVSAIDWYSDTEQSNGVTFDQKRYPLLYAVLNKFVGRMIKHDTLFTDQPDRVVKLLSDPDDGDTTLLRMYREYRTLAIRAQRAANDTVSAAQLVKGLRDSLSSLQNRAADTLLARHDSVSVGVRLDSLAQTQLVTAQNLQTRKMDLYKLAYVRMQHKMDECRKYMQDYSVKLKKFLLALNGKSGAETRDAVFTSAVDNYKQSAQSTNIITYNSTQQAAAGASFAIPSESEVIDAVAIYLAGRIKQESVMWFFNEITTYTKQFEAIKVFFPNTCVLLQSRESSEVPNMGTQWRYALSKDFTDMPRNVLNSAWLRNKWPRVGQYKSYLIGGCDMAELLIKQYSFSDMIKTLYLEPDTVSNQAIDFHDFISLLYAINTELRISDPANVNTFWLLTYEDLRTMNKSELELMLSLLDLKYGGVIGKFIKGMDHTISLDSSVTAENIRRWVGNIGIAISQVEKVRQDFAKDQKGTSASATSGSMYTIYNIWESVDELLHLFKSDNTIKGIYKDTVLSCSKMLGYIDQVHEIYGEILNKNFAGAVTGTLALVDTLVYSAADHKLTLDQGNNLQKTLEGNSSPMLLRKLFAQDANFVIRGGICQATTNSILLASNQSVTIGDTIVKDAVDKDKETNGVKVQLIVRGIDSTGAQGSSSRHHPKMMTLRVTMVPAYGGSREVSLMVRRIDPIYNVSFKQDSIVFGKSSPFAAVYFEQDRHAMDVIARLGSFLSDAASAKSDQQLAKAVESYALPPGSYSRKRNAWYSLDVNALAGPYVGKEWIINNPRFSQPSKQPAYVYGFSVPIGLSFSKTFGTRWSKQDQTLPDEDVLNPDLVKLGRSALWRRSHWTVTLTASVVDLGAIVSFRLTNTTDTTLPHGFNWAQFISPGLHLSVGIAGTPLVAVAGLEYTPKLREFKDDSAAMTPGKTYSNSYNAYRAYVGLMFDLPLFNLWERKRVVK